MPDWRQSAPPEGRELATAISDSCIRKSSFSPNRGGIVYSGIAIGNRVLEGALLLVLAAGGVETAGAQTAPAQSDSRIYEIVDAVSPERLERDIRNLVGFGTRSTVSDTLSDTRGIGAARRWIKSEMDAISAACGGCLEVSFEGALVPGNESGRIRQDTWVVNVMAIQRGTEHPNRYVIMSGDIDSRPSDASDGVTDSPGANDNASGMGGVIEAARVLTRYTFPSSIVYLGLSGEEQGLFGGQHIAGLAVEQGWDIVGVLNNDMIGNIEGVDGVIENNTFRVFSEPTPFTDDLEAHRRRRTTGGEVDGPSRQIARYVAGVAERYIPNLDAIMIYRLDRFGRGGHHRPFNDRGFSGVRTPYGTFSGRFRTYRNTPQVSMVAAFCCVLTYHWIPCSLFKKVIRDVVQQTTEVGAKR